MAVVGGIQVEHDLTRWCRVLLDEDLDERLFQLAVQGHDLLIAAVGIGSDRSQFQPIQRALARQRLPLIPATAILTGRIRLPHEHGQQWIVTQIVVIVEVFISQAQPRHALPNQFLDRVLDLL